ncbi:LysR family transcriptional regulator [Candidatus Finniella inopinata]|uniref:LysR family transcriptional regulator n=1 Tax=Candidatus Finniella inopinata TaxID=1696036 RepID=A0A4Q7DJG2_9PROT|nr:LysR family transcriptional regulator [Candidatus Finniella inopinata]RZI46174.1 LysR family transcriptional regulator [Candidatus Finniella inopinata]
MDWDKLRIFHSVAEIRNLTHAGSALNLSQSAVSRQISNLEKDLNLPLFTRHARGLALTSEGEILFKTTRSIFSQISATASQLAESYDQLGGTLKISATVALGSVWLAPRLPDFCKDYPHLKLQMILTDEDVDFAMREADVAIQFGQQDVDPNLVYEKLFDYRLKIYASKTYLQVNGTPTGPEDLDTHRLIVFGSQMTAPIDNVNWILKLGAEPGTVREPSLVINNAYGILQSVKNGLGIASLADFIAKDHDDLTPIFPDLKVPVVQVFFVYPKQLANSKRIEAFFKFLKQQI